MSQVIGTDLSFYQDDTATPQGVNFVKMRANAQFAILRAGQNLWVDPKFKTYWADAKQAGLPRGSYWFYDSRADPKKQAELWVQALGSDLGELPLFADFEERYGGAYKGWRHWYTFLEQLKGLVRGKEICIYTAYYYWQENGPSATSQASNLKYFDQYPLWVAHYRVDKPLIPKPWGENEWLFWQFTDKGEGPLYGAESGQIDLNYFNGSLEAFRTRFNLPEWTPPPPPVEMTYYRLDLSVRAGPAESQPSLGNLSQAEVVTNLGLSADKNWMQIRRADGLTGWIRIDPFTQVSTPPVVIEPEPEVGTGKFYRVAVNSLRLRSGPGTAYEAIGTLNKDEQVEEVKANSDRTWLKVRRGEEPAGWSAAEYLLAVSATPATPRTQPAPMKGTLFPGVTYVRDVRQTPRKLVIHVLSIDLTTGGLDLLVTPQTGKENEPFCARTTSQFLSEFGAQIAINGDGFTYANPNSYYCPTGRPPVKLNGFAASRSKVYSTPDKETTLYIGRDNKLAIGAAPGHIVHAISGDRPLVAKGKPIAGLDTSLLNPRTALGLTPDGRRLILLVVDGRQADFSEGVNFVELADLLIFYGCYSAMNLDGGGSTTLVVESPEKKPLVLNSPIDSLIPGKERAVANHLGVLIRKPS